MTTTTCPRCLDQNANIDHEGREGETVVWRILHCLTCSFSWRDSEPASAVDPKIRDADFRVDATKVGSYPIVLPPTPR